MALINYYTVIFLLCLSAIENPFELLIQKWEGQEVLDSHFNDMPLRTFHAFF